MRAIFLLGFGSRYSHLATTQMPALEAAFDWRSVLAERAA